LRKQAAWAEREPLKPMGKNFTVKSDTRRSEVKRLIEEGKAAEKE
jgi:hypothetical protein